MKLRDTKTPLHVKYCVPCRLRKKSPLLARFWVGKVMAKPSVGNNLTSLSRQGYDEGPKATSRRYFHSTVGKVLTGQIPTLDSFNRLRQDQSGEPLAETVDTNAKAYAVTKLASYSTERHPMTPENHTSTVPSPNDPTELDPASLRILKLIQGDALTDDERERLDASERRERIDVLLAENATTVQEVRKRLLGELNRLKTADKKKKNDRAFVRNLIRSHGRRITITDSQADALAADLAKQVQESRSAA